jgi:hypothetical protein
MGRLFARLLVLALKSSTVQTGAIEVSRFVARTATAFLLRKLRAGSKTYNDNSGARRVGSTGLE